MEKILENKWRIFFTMSIWFLLSGCTSVPSGVKPVDNFEIERYLGTWYEIARLDHRFERGLTNVSATYAARDDGGVDVLNRGFDPKSGKWKQAKGKAYFAGDKTTGRLKVTFFWPFYGAYNVIDLDEENYSRALVCGPSRSYLWILAREKTLEQAVLDRLRETAAKLGFKTDDLIFVEQN